MILQICMRVLALFTLIGVLGFSTSLKALQNVSADEAYIIENAKKPGWIIRPSGLQIKILTRGTGRLPSPTSDVVVHYTGKFIDGTIFDSSVERGQPTTFPVNGVINGWVEALKLMKEGSKWSLVIPSKLGYGEEGSGDRIYPNATLLFEVEMLEVKTPLVTGFKK